MTRPASTDAWVECRCGARHWGLVGAAGLLLTDGHRVLLQHRAPWSHFGGTWGIPGGARNTGESAIDGALREAAEEAGVITGEVQVIESTVLDHPDWSYTTVLGFTATPRDHVPTDAESIEIRWVNWDDVADYPLLPAFAAAWSGHLGQLSRWRDTHRASSGN